MLFIVDISAVLLILSSKFLVLSTVYYYNLELLQVLVAFDKHQLLKVVITQVEPVSQDRRFSHHQTKMKLQLKKVEIKLNYQSNWQSFQFGCHRCWSLNLRLGFEVQLMKRNKVK